jgi:hypothetical protein
LDSAGPVFDAHGLLQVYGLPSAAQGPATVSSELPVHREQSITFMSRLLIGFHRTWVTVSGDRVASIGVLSAPDFMVDLSNFVKFVQEIKPLGKKIA